ncbi:kinase-like domain-containing protein [Rhizophagus irregularis DAOM 181602=DAOM 197198]|nr:kinase-like domain-containing protein [Rhizophagus irregularis DAOM 181602=DAOM 197198]
MELTNDDSFDPTPKLKSSPVPISFIPLNYYDSNCIRCGDIYTGTSIKYQKYCKKCLLCYLTNITDKNIYLDVYIFTRNLECNEHEIKSTLTKKPIPIIYLPWWHRLPYCKACYLELKFTSDCQKSGNSDLDDFFVNLRLEIHNRLEITKFTDEIKNIDKYYTPEFLFNTIYSTFRNNKAEILMEWIPYSQFTNVKEIAKGGFGIIYQATWLDGSINNINNIEVHHVKSRKRRNNETVILKKFNNSQGISKYFLNELKSNQYCYQVKHHIVKTYGFTKDPKFGDYILVMQYASEGDLHNILREKFTEITWDKQKLAILWQISEGLETIHNSEFIHRDFHSGNILSNLSNGKRHQWQIGDLGLSQPVSAQSNNEIYGVIPYVAPEIFKGCWDSDPTKRPLITEIRKTFGKWFFKNKSIGIFKQAEIKRKELIKLKKLGFKFNGKTHPSAIYTSRSLKSFISSCSSIFSNSKDYNSIELEFDIDIKSSNILGTKRNIEELEINSYGNSGKHIKN